jgi:hypothetical protein
MFSIYSFRALKKWLKTIINITKITERQMTNINELFTILSQLDNQLSIAKDEILLKIENLEDALQNVSLTPEAEEALDSLRTTIQLLDDIVPTVEETTPEEVQ